MNCAEKFKQRPRNSDECVSYCIQQDPDGLCQQHSVGADSPGPVQDSEIIARWVEAPHNLKSGNDLSEELFSDISSRGASTQRLIGDLDERIIAIHAMGEQKARIRRTGSDGRTPQNRRYLGYVLLPVSEVRAVVSDLIAAAARVRVYDTGENGDKYHADIMVADSGFATRKQRSQELQKIRIKLYFMARRMLYVSPLIDPNDPEIAALDLNKSFPGQTNPNLPQS